MVGPDPEVVQIGQRESCRAWEHGHPFRTVRFRPACEALYVAAITWHYLIGEFAAGNPVLTGPNLPHH